MSNEVQTLQKRQREIEKALGAASGDAHSRLHAEYQRNQRRIGVLMLELDKEKRPHIYAR
jgi:hypothetical protein